MFPFIISGRKRGYRGIEFYKTLCVCKSISKSVILAFLRGTLNFLPRRRKTTLVSSEKIKPD